MNDDRCPLPADGGPAFFGAPHGGGCGDYVWTQGLSVRDYFAGQAMAGFLKDQRAWSDGVLCGMADRSYEIADAMLTARARKPT